MKTRYANKNTSVTRKSSSRASMLYRAHTAKYALTGLLVLTVLGNSCSATKPDPISDAISRHFAAKTDYKPGDLITRKDFDQVLKLLKKTKVSVKWFTVLRERIPASDSYLQRLNGGKLGQEFLRKVGAIPGGYANVEDLAGRPGGEKTISQLTRSRDGDKMIRYMATTKGGKEMLSMTPRGATNRAPGPPRIYTAEELRKAMFTLKPPANS